MTDEGETFLARWSKRKTQARTEETAAEIPKPALAHDVTHSTGTAESEADEVPPHDLPPIDSIDANTDLTPWLRKNVPEAWKRAALSRVWATDPAISEFVGLADYAWDWNAPDGVPGFGPLRAGDNVAELLAQVIGERPQAKPDEGIEERPAALDETENEAPVAAAADPGDLPEIASDDFASPNPPDAPQTSIVVAANDSTETDEPMRRRRGGGALPS